MSSEESGKSHQGPKEAYAGNVCLLTFSPSQGKKWGLNVSSLMTHLAEEEAQMPRRTERGKKKTDRRHRKGVR